jgi:hypothetical protein
MSIHDFHSKLMSGNEEGKLFQALRKIRIGGPVLASTEEAVWSVWVQEGTSADAPKPGWSVWQEGSEAMSKA